MTTLIIHQLVRVDFTPGQPTEYRALCGYMSTDKGEFRKEKWGIERVTCEDCISRITGRGE